MIGFIIGLIGILRLEIKIRCDSVLGLQSQNFGQIKGESNQQECSICIETINLDKQKKDIVVLNCGHIFHKRCIDKWAINTPNCPMCRENICDVEVNKLYINI